jgi:hypothetical protein
METEGSLPCSQESTTGHYPKPDKSSPPFPILLLSDLFNTIIRTHNKQD